VTIGGTYQSTFGCAAGFGIIGKASGPTGPVLFGLLGHEYTPYFKTSYFHIHNLLVYAFLNHFQRHIFKPFPKTFPKTHF